jgi:hypothetical protein
MSPDHSHSDKARPDRGDKAIHRRKIWSLMSKSRPTLISNHKITNILRRLRETLMSGTNKSEILLYDSLRSATSFCAITANSANKPEIVARIHKDRQIKKLCVSWVRKHMKTFNNHHRARIYSVNRIRHPVMDRKVINGLQDRLSLSQILKMGTKERHVLRSRIIKINGSFDLLI